VTARDTARAMSEDNVLQTNVELVQSLYAVNLFAATAEEIDRAFRDQLHDGFEFRLPDDYPEGEPVFRGREGVTQMVAMLRDAWSEWRFEPQQFVDAGERVVVFARIVAEGGTSGIPIEMETAHLWTIRDGRAVSLHVHRSRAEALKAAGLSE
jgi:ketosteroid isomerase-like protein